MKKNWFIIVLLLSIIIRLYLIIFTEGTYDIGFWNNDVNEITRIGLVEHYKATSSNEINIFNASPFAGYLMIFLSFLGKLLHLPFKVILRLPLGTLDFLAAFYLLRIFGDNDKKYIYSSLYLLNPLTFILSSYHGNLDSTLAPIILMVIYYLSKKKDILAGSLFGLGILLKWPICLAIPILFFTMPNIKRKLRFFGVSAGIAFVNFIGVFLSAPQVVFNNVFNYRGLMIVTDSGPIWGSRIFLERFILFYERFFSFPPKKSFLKWVLSYLEYTRFIIVLAVTFYAWHNRHRRSALDIGRTIGVVFCIFYGLTNYWAFQYLAWSIPLWLFIGPKFYLLASFLTAGYIYLFYSFVCNSFLLLGEWDLIGRSALPEIVLFFRDMSVLVFLVTTFYFLGNAVISELKKKDSEKTVSPPAENV